MHKPAIGDGDIAFGERHAVEPLAALLIGQLNEAETFRWKVEGAVIAGLTPFSWRGRHSPLLFLASLPAFGMLVLRRFFDAGWTSAPGKALTRYSSQARHLRKRLSRATLESSARPTDDAQALVVLNPMSPKQ